MQSNIRKFCKRKNNEEDTSNQWNKKACQRSRTVLQSLASLRTTATNLNDRAQQNTQQTARNAAMKGYNPAKTHPNNAFNKTNAAQGTIPPRAPTATQQAAHFTTTQDTTSFFATRINKQLDEQRKKFEADLETKRRLEIERETKKQQEILRRQKLAKIRAEEARVQKEAEQAAMRAEQEKLEAEMKKKHAERAVRQAAKIAEYRAKQELEARRQRAKMFSEEDPDDLWGKSCRKNPAVNVQPPRPTPPPPQPRQQQQQQRAWGGGVPFGGFHQPPHGGGSPNNSQDSENETDPEDYASPRSHNTDESGSDRTNSSDRRYNRGASPPHWGHGFDYEEFGEDEEDDDPFDFFGWARDDDYYSGGFGRRSSHQERNNNGARPSFNQHPPPFNNARTTFGNNNNGTTGASGRNAMPNLEQLFANFGVPQQRGTSLNEIERLKAAKTEEEVSQGIITIITRSNRNIVHFAARLGIEHEEGGSSHATSRLARKALLLAYHPDKLMNEGETMRWIGNHITKAVTSETWI